MFKPRLYIAGDALADGTLTAPTHVKLAPSSARIVGTLSQTQAVLQALGLETLAA